jgi:hypothetical protein
MPIAIAGMHRSGTSMITRLLNLCGLYLGKDEDVSFSSNDNPEGFWENAKFQKINDEILAALNGGWDVPPALEIGWETLPHLVPINYDAKQVLEEFSQQPIWGWKDPRNSLTLPFWKRHLPNLKTIICLRNPFEIYRSLTRRGASSSIFSNNLWLLYNQQLLKSTLPEERIFTHYDSFFRDPYSELRRLLNFLELEVSEQAIRRACRSISTILRHHGGSINDLHGTNPPPGLLDLYRELCQRAGPVYGFSLTSDEKAFLQQITPAEEVITTDLKRVIQRISQDLKIATEEKSRLQQEIIDLEKKAARHQHDLKMIFASRSWRLIQALQKIRLFFVPLDSAHEKSIKAIFNLLNIKDRGRSFSRPNRKELMALVPRIRNRTGSVLTKIICIHPRLGGFTSHHYNEAFGFMKEFERRATEFLLLINAHAPAQIITDLHARAVLEDPTFRMEWSFDERSQRFLDMLHEQVDADLNANDCVLITVSTQLEAHALTRWLQELPRNKKPWIVIFFVSDRWNRSGRDEYQRQIAEFHKLNAVISNLVPEDASRLIFGTVTDQLAAELSSLLGTMVEVPPFPIEYGDPSLNDAEKRSVDLPRVAVLGGARREKGSYLLPGIIQATRLLVRAEFLVHLTNNTLTNEEFEVLSHIMEEPSVTVIDRPMTLAEYTHALKSTDIALFPYEIIPYRKRISGVFAEAVAYGKPVIAPHGTWMAEQIQAGRAAGIIFEDLQADSIAQAIAECIKNLKPLQEDAEALSLEWRTGNCLRAFVDFMEEEISIRQKYSVTKIKPMRTISTPNCSFVLSVERGKLESQAVLLAESLREFGGGYANCPVYAVSPRPSQAVSEACRAKLKALGVQVIVEDLLSQNETYGPTARLAACSWAEKNLTSEILVSLDNDAFFAAEPDFRLRGIDFFARPVDFKGICSSGEGDPLDRYWRTISRHLDVDYEQIPWVETTVDQVFVKASYNGGMVAVRREIGLFQKAEAMLHILREADLSPNESVEQQVFASTGFVDVEASRWWGSSQVVLSLAATDLKARIAIAPKTYNVPAHALGDAGGALLKDAILVHYHWMLDQDHHQKSSTLFGNSELPLPVRQWLTQKTPLREIAF